MRIFLVIALMVLSPLSYADKTVDVLGDNIFFDLPKKLKIKENTDKKVIVSNRNKTVTLTLTQTETPADTKTIKQLHPLLSQQYQKAFTQGLKIKKDKTTNKFETKVSHFEFEFVNGKKYLYQISYGVPLNGKLLLINYTISQKSLKDKWLGVGRDLFDTLELNTPY